jgi:flagellar basal body-associated protein FliL
MSILWIILIIVLVLFLLGFFGFRRYRGRSTAAPLRGGRFSATLGR